MRLSPAVVRWLPRPAARLLCGKQGRGATVDPPPSACNHFNGNGGRRESFKMVEGALSATLQRCGNGIRRLAAACIHGNSERVIFIG